MKYTRAPDLEIPRSNRENRSTRMEGNMYKGVYYSTALVGEKKNNSLKVHQKRAADSGEKEEGRGKKGDRD